MKLAPGTAKYPGINSRLGKLKHNANSTLESLVLILITRK